MRCNAPHLITYDALDGELVPVDAPPTVVTVHASHLSRSTMLPAPCRQGAGNMVLLLKWDAWTVTTVGGASTGTNSPSSASYVIRCGALHRIYCATGSSPPSDATLVHNLQTATVQCSSPTTCDAATPPTTITLSLGISSGPGDRTAPGPVTLVGQRRQS